MVFCGPAASQHTAHAPAAEARDVKPIYSQKCFRYQHIADNEKDCQLALHAHMLYRT